MSIEPTIDPDEEFDLLAEDGLIQFVTEYWGRRQAWLPPQFGENELIVGPYALDVNVFGAGYVPTFPNLNAIVVAVNGERYATRGGFIKLPPGQYTIYYVDRRERYLVLSPVEGNTLDGATVTITCGITFKVKAAKAIQNILNPIEALLNACEGALRHVIRTHSHDHFFGETENNDFLTNESIANAVQRQVTANKACSAFSLHHVTVVARQGDPQLLGLRSIKIAQKRADENELQNAQMQALIYQERQKLEVERGKMLAERARSESESRRILAPADERQIRIENQRQVPRLSHEENLREIDVRGEALKALITAEAMPGFSRNPEDLQKLVNKIIKEMPNIAINQAPPHEEEEDLGMTLVQLLIPKKKE